MPSLRRQVLLVGGIYRKEFWSKPTSHSPVEMPSYLFTLISSRFQPQNMLLVILPRYTVTNFIIYHTARLAGNITVGTPDSDDLHTEDRIKSDGYLGLRARVQGLASDLFLPWIKSKSKKSADKVAYHFTACIASASTQISFSALSKSNNDETVLLDRLLKQKQRQDRDGTTVPFWSC